ncbi:MAG: KH domain-containing protein [Coriobacteriia bacterium]|nr:KH domain-containing protein [Coriobacteriia bacterium]
MERECIKEAATVAEAVDAALEELGVQQDAVGYEVLEEPGRKMFGMGAERGAKVRVWVRDEAVAEIEDAKRIAREVLEIEEQSPGAPVVIVEDGGTENSRGIERPDLSDEELDKVADTAVEVVQTILKTFGIEGSSIEEYEGDEGEIILDVVGGDLAVLIGRHGRTLDALQALSSAITSRKLGFRYPIIVDVEGYRHRRRQKLEDIARRSADRAARQHISVKLRPMTAFERRVVHVALRNDSRIVTQSEGEDPFRMVVIVPK